MVCSRGTSLGGLVETPADRRFIVVTVPAAAGFPAAEAVMETWAVGLSVLVEWGFGNVCGPDGELLNWWQASEACPAGCICQGST
jgi:hypothetical protein